MAQNVSGFCSGYQLAIGGTGSDRAIDVATTINNNYFIAGNSSSFGSGQQILVSKLTETGSLLWSRTFGGQGNESVRKIKSTADGGLLVVGQTQSFSNFRGDILALKIDSNGNLLWSRLFGAGSQYGDLGMDIIETSDGGYALTGIINIGGYVADLLVMKLNNAADPVWSKRFDRGDGEDGVGLVQKGDTLIVASDLMNMSSHYELHLMKLKLKDGAFLMSKKLKPGQRGLFNPHLFRNPAASGYIVSGHTIDFADYSRMNHTVLTLTDDFNIVRTKLITADVPTNDFFTGFVPMADGSFIGSASPQSGADAYVYRINDDNTIQYAKRFNNSNDRRFSRLAVSGNKVFAAGSAVQNGQEDFFVASFGIDGSINASCDVEGITLRIDQPFYSASHFTWPSITEINFSNTTIHLPAQEVAPGRTSLCNKTSGIDFAYQQDPCNTKLVRFNSYVSGFETYQWDFGNGKQEANNQMPVVQYDDYGAYNVTLSAKDSSGCVDTVSKKIAINLEPGQFLFQDTTVCKGDFVILRPTERHVNYCWQAPGINDISSYNPSFRADTTVNYRFTAEVEGQNLVVNNDFSAGNFGFTSQMDYNPATGTTPGSFTVATNANAWNASFTSCLKIGGGESEMLLVNGTIGASVVVWSQTVAVQPQTNYGFSVYSHTISQQQTAMRFRISGIPVSDWFNLQAGQCVWHKPMTTWNSGQITTAKLEIETFTMFGDGNDVGLDDIFFGPIIMQTGTATVKVVDKPLLSVIADTTICAGKTVKLQAQSAGSLSYRWSPATDLSDATIANPVASPKVTTKYYVTVTGAGGCTSTDSILVTVATPQQCNTPPVVGNFTTPDTVCVNTPVKITNTSSGVTSFYWNFCVADLNAVPDGQNIGNPGNNLSQPVFMDYAFDKGNYYGFVINHYPGGLIRLDFGNSLLNTPSSVNLGNFAGIIPPGYGAEGIQILQSEGKWYAIVVGGYQPSGSTPRILKIDFGPDLNNPTPIATNWGNLGNMSQPIDLHVFREGDNWYGFTLNGENNTITRFNFTNSFSNTPTAINLGNIGNLSYPTGIFAISDAGFWRVFVLNAGNSANGTSASLSRLDFGTSLLNTPVGVNLGNPGNVLNLSRDLTIMRQCGQIVGFVVNAKPTNDIVKLDFHNDLSATPELISLGNIGNAAFPHSISKLFRVNDNVYGFITNVDNNSLTRLRFAGCNSVNMLNSTQQHPSSVSYNKPGVYNINLTVDDGLPTQAAYCRQVVVVAGTHTPLQVKSICSGDSLLLTSSATTGNIWQNGSTAYAIYAKTAGLYWVQSTTAGGCVNVDSFLVDLKPMPVVSLGNDKTFCAGDSLLLDAGNPGAQFYWNNGQTLQQIMVRQRGIYHVTITKNGCTIEDSTEITTLPLPAVSINGTTTICRDGETAIAASGAEIYAWSPVQGLSSPLSATTLASPLSTTKYVLTATGSNGCKTKDSVIIRVDPRPVFHAFSVRPVVCRGDTVTLIASGGDRYYWLPAVSVAPNNGNTVIAMPASTTLYKVMIEEDLCGLKDSIFVPVRVADKPIVQTVKSNDITCFTGEATLTTGGGSYYLWQPATGLSDPTSAKPLVRINTTTTYHVLITTNEGCVVEDSITLNVFKNDDGSGFPVPTAFTPNNDGRNDCFGVRYWGDVAEYSMRLYNRWGEVVFQSNNPSLCWNGYYKGQLQPPDVYVYLIKAKTRCGDVLRKGTFTLIR